MGLAPEGSACEVVERACKLEYDGRYVCTMQIQCERARRRLVSIQAAMPTRPGHLDSALADSALAALALARPSDSSGAASPSSPQDGAQAWRAAGRGLQCPAWCADLSNASGMLPRLAAVQSVAQPHACDSSAGQPCCRLLFNACWLLHSTSRPPPAQSRQPPLPPPPPLGERPPCSIASEPSCTLPPFLRCRGAAAADGWWRWRQPRPR